MRLYIVGSQVDSGGMCVGGLADLVAGSYAFCFNWSCEIVYSWKSSQFRRHVCLQGDAVFCCMSLGFVFFKLLDFYVFSSDMNT